MSLQDQFNPSDWAAVYESDSSDLAPFRIGAQLVSEVCFGLPRGGPLLDAGCGTGHLAAQLAPRFSPLIALDQDPAMLRFARAKWARSGIHFVNAKAGRFPFRDASISIVTAVSLLGCLPSPDVFFRETHRILKPSGLLVFTCTNAQSLLLRLNGALKKLRRKQEDEGRFQLYAVGEMKKRLGEAGLKVRTIQTYNFFLNPWGFLFPPKYCLKAFKWLGRFSTSRYLGRNFLVIAERT